MTATQIHELNEKFQRKSVQISELIPSGGLTEATSAMIRSARKIDAQFLKLIQAPSESHFNRIMDKMEEEMDEILFILDQLELANKKRNISLITEFLKEGYNLVSVYSKCFDYIISKKITEEE